jgi:hypothetical protein
MKSELHSNAQTSEVSDEELQNVIADFLEMGHVENIVAMFKQESRYYTWVGKLLEDERFAVRLGVSVLFEYLKEQVPGELHLALPSLAKALRHATPWVRGEAASVLALIGSPEAINLVKPLENDPAPEVASLVRDIIQEQTT